jgi:hypothetical protein
VLKRLFFLGIFAASSVAAHAQPGAAYKSQAPIFIGGFFSGIQPDFGSNTIDALGAYIDIPVWRIVSVEGEMRFGHFHTQNGIMESTYLVGPRVAYELPHGFIPYGKFMFGSGAFTYPFNEGSDHHTVLAYGGGIDYQLTQRFYLRGDYERQRWSFGQGTINPSAFSAGVSYRLFR